jgi:hypothetical protein
MNSGPATVADVHRLLRALQAEQRQHHAAVLIELAEIRARADAPHKPAGAVHRTDAPVLGPLMPLLYREWPSQVFVVAEIIAMAEIDAGFRQALQPLCATAADPAKRLGRLLRRNAGRSAGGLTLELRRTTSPLAYAVV